MKTPLFSLLVLAMAAPLLRADDVALLTLRVGKEKVDRQVAIEFYEAEAPRAVENFRKLAKKGFYKGTTVHRVFPHTLVQMGDPLSRKKDRSEVGTGGPGYTLEPEIRRKHVAGAVAAARLPDRINPSRRSNGSQFYICLEPMPALDGQYTVFGRVISGMDQLDLVSTKAADTNDNPVERIQIRSVKIVPREKVPSAPAPAPAKPSAKAGGKAAAKPAAAPAAPAKKPWWKIFG